MKILLVEDDPGIGRFVSRGLTAEGFAVEWLRSGQAARHALRKDGISVAILDLGLPDMDGTALCSEARRDGVQTPVLMLTARDGLDDKLDGFRCGADDYLTKPFAFEELLARLNVLARRSGGTRDEALTVGRLQIDLRARTAAVGGAPVSLAGREFAVLACLARRPGQTVTRETLLDEAWGFDATVTANAVDVYVGYLRRRLAGLDGAPCIETVRGVGFRLVGG
jgi:DNA-binding response OmpR family regulator